MMQFEGLYRSELDYARFTRTVRRLLAILAGLMVCVGLMPRPLSAQELRAFWADGFNPAIKSREEIDDLLRRLQKANCNAVFVQVRKSADAYYVSRYDPWASDNPERFDSLEHLIEQAHRLNPPIQVHAWINTCAVGKSRGNPLHVTVAHPDWISLSDKGETHDGEATKIDPGHPLAADYTFRVYLDVLRHYDVDGIHFDFVRYGGTNWGYNPMSVARFNARFGRKGFPSPSDPLWQQWRRDQVTALVRKVYVMAAALKPRVAVSAATITWGKGPESRQEWETRSAAMTRVFQDWRSWMEEGILDLNCMMSYYRETRHAGWYRLWLDWAKDHQYRRYAVPACGVWLNTIPDTLKQIEAVRAPSRRGNRAAGVMLYSYAGTNSTADGKEERYNESFYEALGNDSAHGPAPFPRPSVPPVLYWKTNPTTGHVKGVVLDAESLAPVDGATVEIRTSPPRRQFTDGTGFFAFVDVKPARLTLQVTARGYAPVNRTVTVVKGRVATTHIFVGSPSTPFAHSGIELEKAPDGTPVRLADALVVGGTDHFIDRCFVTLPGMDAALQVRPAVTPVLALQAGDVVAVTGTMDTDNGERFVRDAVVQLVDMRMPPGKGSTDTAAGQSRFPADVRLLAPGLARITANVSRVNPETATLDAPNVAGISSTEVLLTGRKDCGIEDPETPLAAPRHLSRVTVTGVLCTAVRDGRTVLILRPRSFADIAEDVPPMHVLLPMLMKIAVGPVVMAVVCYRRRG